MTRQRKNVRLDKWMVNLTCLPANQPITPFALGVYSGTPVFLNLLATEHVVAINASDNLSLLFNLINLSDPEEGGSSLSTFKMIMQN